MKRFRQTVTTAALNWADLADDLAFDAATEVGAIGLPAAHTNGA